MSFRGLSIQKYGLYELRQRKKFFNSSTVEPSVLLAETKIRAIVASVEEDPAQALALPSEKAKAIVHEICDCRKVISLNRHAYERWLTKRCTEAQTTLEMEWETRGKSLLGIKLPRDVLNYLCKTIEDELCTKPLASMSEAYESSGALCAMFNFMANEPWINIPVGIDIVTTGMEIAALRKWMSGVYEELLKQHPSLLESCSLSYKPVKITPLNA